MQDIKKTYSAFDLLWLFLKKMPKFTYWRMFAQCEVHIFQGRRQVLRCRSVYHVGLISKHECKERKEEEETITKVYTNPEQ